MEILKLISILLTHTIFCAILYAVACNILTSFIHNFSDVIDIKTIFMSFSVYSRDISNALKKILGIRNKSEINESESIYNITTHSLLEKTIFTYYRQQINFDNYAVYSLSSH